MLIPSELFRQAADALGVKVNCLFHATAQIRFAYLYGNRAEAMRAFHFQYVDGLVLFEVVVPNSFVTTGYIIACAQERGQPYEPVHSLPLAKAIEGIL